MSDLLKYFQIPYLENGRTMEGLDCYGLVLQWYKNELNVDLPDYKGIATTEAELNDNPIIAEKACDGFFPINKFSVRAHDVVTFCNESTTPNHIGVMIGKTDFIHALAGYGCTTSKLKTWNRKLYSCYRYKEST